MGTAQRYRAGGRRLRRSSGPIPPPVCYRLCGAIASGAVSSRTRRRLAVATAMVVTTLVATSCSSDDADAESLRDPAAAADAILTRRAAEFDPTVDGDGSVSTDTDAPSTTTSTLPGIIVNQFLLTLDECFDRVEALSGGVETVVTTRLPCDEPHLAQIFARVKYPAEHPSFYPGDDIMEDYALATCYVYFEPWVGSLYETSDLEIRAITPPRDAFEDQGYRWIQCYVERGDGEPLTDSARGSGL